MSHVFPGEGRGPELTPTWTPAFAGEQKRYPTGKQS